MSHELVGKAVLLAFNTEAAGATYDCVYGGETLLNKALIALSKSGVQAVKIICRGSQREKLALMIEAIRHRIACDYEFVELPSTALLSETIARAVEKWEDVFFVFAIDKIVHPTFFAQAGELAALQKPLLFAYKNVWLHDGRVVFANSFPEKFRVIFHDPRAFTKIALSKPVFPEAAFASTTSSVVEISPELKYGLISTDIVICRRADFSNMTANNFAEMIHYWREKQLLVVGFVEKAWWLKVTGKEPQKQVREFFWKIAFKEISGEFSKLVNSRLSKPLTFLFVRLGFSPNAISVIELLLFLVA